MKRTFDATQAEQRLAEAKLAKAEAARTRIEVAQRDLEVARTLVTKAGKTHDLGEVPTQLKGGGSGGKP